MWRSYLTMKICVTMIMFGNDFICPIDDESDENENSLNWEDIIDIIDIQQNANQSTSIQNEGCNHNNQKHPKV